MIFKSGKELYEHIASDCVDGPAWDSLVPEIQEHYNARAARDYEVPEPQALPPMNEWVAWFREGQPPELKPEYTVNLLLRMNFQGKEKDLVDKNLLLQKRWNVEEQVSRVNWQLDDDQLGQVGFYMITSYGNKGPNADREPIAKINLKEIPNMEDE